MDNRNDDAPTEEHNDGVALCWNKSKHKNILASAVVALGRRFAKGGFCVKNNLFMFGANKMVYDVRG
jgi:hypothetical protein